MPLSQYTTTPPRSGISLLYYSNATSIPTPIYEDTNLHRLSQDTLRQAKNTHAMSKLGRNAGFDCIIGPAPSDEQHPHNPVIIP